MVKVGDTVKAGQRLATTGNVGFTTGPHLHFQLNIGAGDEDHILMFAFRDTRHGSVVPVAGYHYTSSGIARVSNVDNLDRLRQHLQEPTVGLLSYQTSKALLEAGLLWLKVEDREELIPVKDEASLCEESDEEALRAYPSEHTCLVCNVVVIESLLRQGRESRFVRRGKIPPVYLSCACNFDRDTETGEIHSYEIAIRDHQERCHAEACDAPDTVGFSLDPRYQSDWLAYFKARFKLSKQVEVYQGDVFLRNQLSTAGLQPGEEAYPVYGLHRTTLERFSSDAIASKDMRRRKKEFLGHGGCVVVFRKETSDAEPFGMWFAWLVLADHLFLLDIQNGKVESSLGDSIAGLGWSQPPRREVYFAAFA